jgi:hypothetical protein
MKRRFFAFGCSYTYWEHQTWADFVGVNFEYYHNMGIAGSCNTYMMHRLLETDMSHKFNPETDIVIIGLTGFGRFTFLEQDPNTMHYEWKTNGDILFKNPDHPEKAKWIANNLYSFRWAAHNSWVAVKTMKNFLTSKNIEHRIFMALDNSHYIKEAELLELEPKYGVQPFRLEVKIREIFDTLDFTETIEDYRAIRIRDTNPEETLLHHPIKEVHYGFAKRHFNDLLTEKSDELLNKNDKTFTVEARR